MIVATNHVMKGERVTFTPLQLDNLYTHFEWNNDPELNHLDSDVPFAEETLGDFKKRFERMLYEPSPTEQDFEVYAEDGTLIGVAFLTEISEHHARCTAGITIGDRRYWGKGYGRDALTVLLDYCFDTLGLHRVLTETFEFNEAWRRLVQWAGFEREGLIRDYIHRGEQYWDKELYGLLEDAYRYRKLHAMAGR